MADELEWKVLDDDAPDEPELARPAPKPAPRRNGPPKAVVALVLAGVAALGVPWFVSQQSQSQLHASVTTLAQAEPRLDSIPFGIRSASVLTVERIVDDGAGRIQATLGYTAVAYDGTPLRFRLTRAFVAEGIALRPEPLGIDSTVATLIPPDGTGHVAVEVLADDRDFIATQIMPYLEDLADRACEFWTCPPTARATLSFTTVTADSDQPALEPLAGSWMLAGIVNDFNISPARLPAPHVAGMPADAITLAAYRRTLALRMLPLLARAVSEPFRRPLPTSTHALVVGALATRTAVLLGLEPEAIATSRPMPDDAGLITGAPDRRVVIAPRALLRLNALLGEPGSAIERDLWRRINARPVDAVESTILAAQADGRPPEEALTLVFGATQARALLVQLARPDWRALVACSHAIHFYDGQGVETISWEIQSNDPILQPGPLSSDGAFQLLTLMGQPLVLQRETGRWWWLTSGGTDYPARLNLFWVGPRSLVVVDALQGDNRFDVRLDDSVPGQLRFQVEPVPDSSREMYASWPGTDYSVSVPDYNETEPKVFHTIRILDANGAVVSDWGEAAWPSLNERTGEVAVFSRYLAATGSPEYKVTVYSGPADPTGRVIWQSSTFGWTLRAEPAFAAIRWTTEFDDLIGLLLPMADAPFWTATPVLWTMDPRTAAAHELPPPQVAGSSIFNFSISANGRYLALMSPAEGGQATQAQIVSLSDGVVVRQFTSFFGYLEWAPHADAFVRFTDDSAEIYSGPGSDALVWTSTNQGCHDVIWRPAQ